MGSELVRQKVEKLISDGLLEIGDGYRAKNSELGNEGIPFARAANINVGFKFDGADRFPAERLSVLGGKMSRPGDVVFTSKGTVGRFAFVDEATQPFVYSPQLCYWRSLDPKRIYPRYLYFWMQSQEFLHQIGYLKGQTDMADYVSLRDQRRMTLTIPDPEVQKGISEFLGAVEDRIDLLRQTNTTLEAIAQALFKSWFVDFEPVHAKAEGREPAAMDAAIAALFPDEFEESGLGLIPKGWARSSLGDVCAAKGGCIQTGPFGSQLHASDYVPVGVPIVMPQDLAGRRVAEDKVARVPSSDADRLARHKLKSGDIVFSRRGDVGRHAVVSEREVGWLCGTGCLLVRPGESESISTFVSAALARPESLEWLVRNAVGATMPNLNTKILSRLPIISPPDELVRDFERIASPLEHRVSANHAQMKSLADLRDTLLPRLISGKLRLPEATAELDKATQGNSKQKICAP